MTGLIVLAAWITSGLALAALLADDDEARWDWAPIAILFGPLWASVALDRRARVPARSPSAEQPRQHQPHTSLPTRLHR